MTLPNQWLRNNYLALICGLAVLILAGILPVVGFLNSNDEFVFTGAAPMSRYDTATYYSWIEQARQGQIFFDSLYSSESRENVFFHPLFLLMGWTAELLNVGNAVIYHLFRVLLGIIFLAVLYKFLKNFFTRNTDLLMALVVVALSSGVGWMGFVNSTDRWMPEFNIFLSIYQSPLNLFSLILMILFFDRIYRFDLNSRDVLICVVLLSLLIISHPYIVVTCFLISLVYFGVNFNRLGFQSQTLRLITVWLLTFPALYWQIYVLSTDQGLGMWAFIETNVPSPGAVDYITGLGLLIPLATLGAGIAYRNKLINEYILILIWIAIIAGLLFYPGLERFQRKFSQGLQIPISILSVLGLRWWLSNFQNFKIKNFAAAISIIVLATGNIYLLIEQHELYSTPAKPFFISKSEYDALDWLKHNTSKEDLMLSGIELSNWIPAFAGRSVYAGHHDQTISAQSKYSLLTAAMSRDSSQLEILIDNYNIDYIILDSELRSISDTMQLDFKNINLVYRNDSIQVYRSVRHD